MPASVSRNRFGAINRVALPCSCWEMMVLVVWTVFSTSPVWVDTARR
jgi:hypothetical protein